MTDETIRIVHYLNQFFAGLGGEDHADLGPLAKSEPVGPALALARLLGDAGTVVGTVICGDNYFNEHPRDAVGDILRKAAVLRPHVIVAGPAFGSGRYGVACAQVCKTAVRELGIPAVTGMKADNPGVALGLPDVHIVPTGETAATMHRALSAIASLALKLARREALAAPRDEGYLPRGIRVNVLVEQNAAERAFNMMLARLRGSAWETEVPLPTFDHVPPAAPIQDLRRARIALVCEGGVVPKGNPDRIESRRASKWMRYSIQGLADLIGEAWECVHGGFDTAVANDDPDRLVPVDALRTLEAEGAIGVLHDDYWMTVGAGTSVELARQFGREIAAELTGSRIDGALMVAT